MSQITGKKKERKKKEETKQIRHCTVWSVCVVVIVCVCVLEEGEDKTKGKRNLLLISLNVKKKNCEIYHLIKSKLLDNDNGTKRTKQNLFCQ